MGFSEGQDFPGQLVFFLIHQGLAIAHRILGRLVLVRRKHGGFGGKGLLKGGAGGLQLM